ncbi:MAG: efflux transporter outer membrane subunit [Verrucomicrobiales bacterium]|nr:efflux transporter outer membrane subunit [Verrucomicrobiales bacterium]
MSILWSSIVHLSTCLHAIHRPTAILFTLATCCVLPACLTLDSGGNPLAGHLSSQTPDHWQGMPIAVPQKAATAWIHDFHNSELTSLVSQAVDENYQLLAAAARVRAAGARVRISGADRYPQLSLGQNSNRSQRLRGARFQKTTANQFLLSGDIAWETDLWGRLSDLQQASRDQLAASSADYQASRLSLAADVIKTTLDLIEFRMQTELSRQTLKSLETNLEILDGKLEVGDVNDRTALEISLSRSDVARAKASIAQQQRDADGAQRRLETLLGNYPSGKITALRSFPKVTRSVPVGLPSELLLRRPDIVAAEHRIDAALKNVSASRKALLPSLRLTAGGGTSTTQAYQDILDPKALVWNIGYGLSQPLFEGGRLRANVQLSKAQRDELAAQYADTALTAFREVETALAAEAFFKQQEKHLKQASKEALLAEELSLTQYERGLVDIITVLESQRRAFTSRSTLLSIKNQRLQNRVDLYLALGGDFDHPSDAHSQPVKNLPKSSP